MIQDAQASSGKSIRTFLTEKIPAYIKMFEPGSSRSLQIAQLEFTTGAQDWQMIKVFDSQVEHEDDDSEEEFMYNQGASLGHAATAKTTPGAYS